MINGYYTDIIPISLWLFNIAMENGWKWSIEIDGLPINSMVVFHGYVE